MTPLAEGIETEEEWRFLAARGLRRRARASCSRGPCRPEEILAMHRRSGLTVVDGGLAV